MMFEGLFGAEIRDQITGIYDGDFACRCYEIVRADHNTYGLVTEAYRRIRAFELLCRGIDEGTIYMLLEMQIEDLLPKGVERRFIASKYACVTLRLLAEQIFKIQASCVQSESVMKRARKHQEIMMRNDAKRAALHGRCSGNRERSRFCGGNRSRM